VADEYFHNIHIYNHQTPLRALLLRYKHTTPPTRPHSKLSLRSLQLIRQRDIRLHMRVGNGQMKEALVVKQSLWELVLKERP
jgi:hypothetical protein